VPEADAGRELAHHLPDAPRWLETRALLLSGFAEITGGTSVQSGFVARVVRDAISAIAVVGCPPASAVVGATEGITEMTPIIAQVDNAEHVRRALEHARGPDWRGERAILHTLRDDTALPATLSGRDIRLLRPDDPLDHLPPGLRYEIGEARKMAPVAAVIVDGQAASFCYPVWRTETLWDISVDTLEAHRGKALGSYAVRFLIDLLRRDGLEPVWGALESNGASLRLAAKLGFQPVDSLVWFSRGPWAFLTAGFQG
jgi:GNAT superfamily N-acetyltransferase